MSQQRAIGFSLTRWHDKPLNDEHLVAIEGMTPQPQWEELEAQTKLPFNGHFMSTVDKFSDEEIQLVTDDITAEKLAEADAIATL